MLPMIRNKCPDVNGFLTPWNCHLDLMLGSAPASDANEAASAEEFLHTQIESQDSVT